MAQGDYRIQDTGGSNVTPSRKYLSQKRTGGSSLTRQTLPGEPVKASASGSQYLIPLLTGDPELGTDFFVGVCQTTSTEEATTHGEIEVYVAIPMLTVMAAKATTSSTADTQAEIDALLNDKVAGDVSSLVYTIDAAEGHDDNIHGFCLVGGNPATAEMYFIIVPRVSVFGSVT